jgi:hypothetical protein
MTSKAAVTGASTFAQSIAVFRLKRPEFSKNTLNACL